MKVEKFLLDEAKRMGGYVIIDGQKVPMISKIQPQADQSQALREMDAKMQDYTDKSCAATGKTANYCARQSIPDRHNHGGNDGRCL